MDIGSAFAGVSFLKKMFDGYLEGLTKEQVLELKSLSLQKVIDIQSAMYQQNEELIKTKDEIEKLKQELNLLKDIEKRKALYSLVKTEAQTFVYKYNGEPEHYVCPMCMEHNSAIHILQRSANFEYRGQSHCPHCKNHFKIAEPTRFKAPKQKPKSTWVFFGD